MGPDGALRACQEARDAGLVRYIGVTGHGVGIAQMHLRSLERFDFRIVKLRHFFYIEICKGLFISFTLFQNGNPAEPRLRTF